MPHQLLLNNIIRNTFTSAVKYQPIIISIFKSGPLSSINKPNSSFSYYILCEKFTLESWIIDSGACDHMWISFKWFHSYHDITPIYVKIPNGQFSISKHIGTINFSFDFVLTNVLHVPKIFLNLVFVSITQLHVELQHISKEQKQPKSQIPSIK